MTTTKITEAVSTTATDNEPTTKPVSLTKTTTKAVATIATSDESTTKLVSHK
eukprot:CAMPEP_0198142602 /NCGR_PEP_ID=MMETSP1443-20131203/5353_1 /TAXON_ID=186043 /ORGANISM="Entomoneis sp., Strain CCMP2396" /LENGTH=51 /DNA_ID=CAMNT_0043805655 /DNA_START=213 /DNA_END=368 /DNA_ORIENTATION=+